MDGKALCESMRVQLDWAGGLGVSPAGGLYGWEGSDTGSEVGQEEESRAGAECRPGFQRGRGQTRARMLKSTLWN